MATVQIPACIRTLADMMARLGNPPLDRVRFHPYPGSATVRDVIAIQDREGRNCELIEGVLLEKPMGKEESELAVMLGGLISSFVRKRNLGTTSGEAGAHEIKPDLVRIPDIAFTNWDRIPGRRRSGEPIPRVVPNLAIEILSRGNTPGEMKVKRTEYFEAGVELVWEIDPKRRRAKVYRSLTDVRTLTEGDRLDGEHVLPGFELPLAELVGELDRHG
ncbi:MAG TPA: Uma2 family endonuclease [Pirellulales bacterium]|nr:Uma2 family endonuclease [Pirellulales bacterium]